jgi:hypothetical protein
MDRLIFNFSEKPNKVWLNESKLFWNRSEVNRDTIWMGEALMSILIILDAFLMQ